MCSHAERGNKEIATQMSASSPYNRVLLKLSGESFSHAGEQPMAITWRLHTALPGDLFTAFAAAVA